jgi:hypothetical protein
MNFFSHLPKICDNFLFKPPADVEGVTTSHFVVETVKLDFRLVSLVLTVTLLVLAVAALELVLASESTVIIAIEAIKL